MRCSPRTASPVLTERRSSSAAGSPPRAAGSPARREEEGEDLPRSPGEVPAREWSDPRPLTGSNAKCDRRGRRPVVQPARCGECRRRHSPHRSVRGRGAGHHQGAIAVPPGSVKGRLRREGERPGFCSWSSWSGSAGWGASSCSGIAACWWTTTRHPRHPRPGPGRRGPAGSVSSLRAALRQPSAGSQPVQRWQAVRDRPAGLPRPPPLRCCA